jgi:hypothetical protein
MGLSSVAEEVPVTITPTQKITTGDKYLQEGDTIDFKDVNSNELISGTIRELTPNGFEGRPATLFIDTFKYKNSNKTLSGKLYLQGGAHKKAQEFANNTELGITSVFIRGGEVILKPDKTKLVVFFSDFVNSEDTPVKIKPQEVVSTTHDEIEVGDSIRFVVQKDVYKNGKLYIKKGSLICGFVDYVSENGWASDNAQIDIKYFKVKNVDGKLITIENPISINGFEILKYKGNRFAQFFNYCGVAFRGKEVDINPEKDDVEFNIWIK